VTLTDLLNLAARLRAGGDEKLMDEFDAHQTSGQMALAVL
jgi:hypothetical protein